MEYEKYKLEIKEKWLRQNCCQSQLLGPNLLPMRPNFGYYIKVEGLDISEDIFKEEYDTISKAYFSVMKKLDAYYKENNK